MSIETRPLFRLEATVAPPRVTPEGPHGERRFIPVTGGRFTGDRLSGVLLDGGADCQLVRPDGVVEMDVRVTLQADDGTLILLKTFGLRHAPEAVQVRMGRGEKVDRREYYFREFMWFEAPEGAYSWLNRLLAIGTGERLTDVVLLDVYEVL